jgi:hypothetical protein
MWYGVLVAAVGSISGVCVALYYRWKTAMQAATIVGLQKDNESLRRDLSDRDKALAADVLAMQKLRDDGDASVARVTKELEDTRADLDKHKAALKVLRLRNPDAVNAALGELFPPVPNKNGDKGGGTPSGSAGRP